MQVALLVAGIVAPVFLLALIGVIWDRLGRDFPVAFVSDLAMRLAAPCLIFAALVATDVALETLWRTALAALLAYGLVMALSWAVLRLFGMPGRIYLAPMSFGNTGNLGLPVALFAFGQAGLDLAVVVFAVSAVLMYPLGIWMVAGGRLKLQFLLEPVVIAVLLAVLFMATGLQLPAWASNAIALVGQMAIPLMLLTLGVALSRLRPSGLGNLVGLALVKVVLCVGAALIAGRLLGLPPLALSVLVLQLVTPVAVTAYLIAQSRGVGAPQVAAFCMVSTLLSVLVLPMVLAFAL